MRGLSGGRMQSSCHQLLRSSRRFGRRDGHERWRRQESLDRPLSHGVQDEIIRPQLDRLRRSEAHDFSRASKWLIVPSGSKYSDSQTPFWHQCSTWVLHGPPLDILCLFKSRLSCSSSAKLWASLTRFLSLAVATARTGCSVVLVQDVYWL